MATSKFALIVFLDEHTPGLTPGYPLPTPPVHPWFPGHGNAGTDPGFGVRSPVDPGYGIPGGGPHPWLPGYGRPDRPDNTLPGRPPYPTTGPVPPPVGPDNTLPPTTPPPTISLPIVLPPDIATDPERLFELKYSPMYGWVLVPVNDDPQPK